MRRHIYIINKYACMRKVRKCPDIPPQVPTMTPNYISYINHWGNITHSFGVR